MWVRTRIHLNVNSMREFTAHQLNDTLRKHSISAGTALTMAELKAMFLHARNAAALPLIIYNTEKANFL